MATYKLLSIQDSGRALVQVTFDAPVNGKAGDTWSLAVPTDSLASLDDAIQVEIDRYVAETAAKVAPPVVAEITAAQNKNRTPVRKAVVGG